MRAGVAVIMGVTLVRLAITGHHRQFVRAGMGPLLLIAGVVLVLVAAASLALDDPGATENAHDDCHAHDAESTIGPGWLLVLPVLALFLVAPPPLGSWGFQRVGRTTNAGNYRPLPASTVPVPIRIREVVGRADAGGQSLRDRTLSLVGFVVPHSGGFALARYSIACCAADAQGAQVVVTGVAAPPADTWIRLTATFEAVRGDDTVVRATSFDVLASPAEPFE